MAEQNHNFDIDQFCLTLQTFIQKYPVTVNEMLKIQSRMKVMLV